MPAPDLLTQATQAHAAGRLDEAESALGRALEADSRNPQALLLLGIVYAKKDRLRDAVSALERAADLDRSSFQARLWLSMTCRKLGDPELTLRFAQEAAALRPDDPQVQSQLGLALLDVRRFSEARDYFQKALARAPSVAQLHYSLGLALRGLRDGPGAIAAFRKAAELAPSSMPILKSARQALMDEFDPAGAAECARAIVKLEPSSGEARLWLARALLEDNQPLEAQKEVDRAAELEPESGLSYTLRGAALQVSGRIEEAEIFFRKSIEAEPRQGSAYLALASSRRIKEADRPLVDRMIELSLDSGLSANHLGQLHYGIGKAQEDLGEYESAMRHFDEANRLTHDAKFGAGTFDRHPMQSSYDFAIRMFSKVSMAPAGSQSSLPIFVLGMMRSGTTLIEQVLSSHPDVGAAGEQRFWSDHRNDAWQPGGAGIDPESLRSLAKAYENSLRRVCPEKSRVVDKMPVNYEMIGLIHSAFPKAKVIHATRNPVDTCISIYTTPNRNRIEWAHDKADIVFAYRQYRRLMDHWRRVLPEDAMIEIRYEDMVEDREKTTRRLIEFCELEWNDACLRPEKNERLVVTPSVWQVRQPVYTTSLARWKRYEPWLGAFAEMMEE